MGLFSAAELADLRATQEDAMPMTCSVSVPGTATADGMGGWIEGTPTATAGIACRVGSPSATDQQIAGKQGQSVDSVVTLPYGTNVPDSSAITVVDTGKTYDVQFTNAEQTYRTAVRAVCRTAR